MSDIQRDKVEQALELICERGCARVREIIEEIRLGKIPEVAKQLNREEQALLLEELVLVMNAYQGSCPT